MTGPQLLVGYGMTLLTVLTLFFAALPPVPAAGEAEVIIRVTPPQIIYVGDLLPLPDRNPARAP